MILDKEGDLWLYADIDPPDWYCPTNGRYVVWVNMVTMVSWIRQDPTQLWYATKWHMNLPLFDELIRAEACREIMGYANDG
jgi:hypothetical protein